MDTTKNRIPYGLLTEEEKALFCPEAKKRRMYDSHFEIWENNDDSGGFDKVLTYRLKILPEEWYYIRGFSDSGEFEEVRQGKDILSTMILPFSKIVRPATSEEIPKPKAWEGEQLVGVMVRIL